MASQKHSPLSRYSSKEMLLLHSGENKYKIWRKLWVWLAEAEQALGVNISQEQIEEMRDMVDNINTKEALYEEHVTRNEILAHINVFAKQCPKAAPIINLGATNYYISDNTALIIIKSSIDLILPRLASIIYNLKNFAETYKDLPMVGLIHLQPTVMTTLGKRTCMWINDLLMDEYALRRFRNEMRFLGIKGVIGNQQVILNLFEGNHEKVNKLEYKVATLAGFDKLYYITGQTYSRKVEIEILGILSSLGTSIHKMCSDLRILASRKLIEEPADGAVTYKRYPYKSERCCSLARYLITVNVNAANAQASQWMEGTLDDAALHHMTASFLCADGALVTLEKIVKGLIVYPKLIDRNNAEEVQFIIMENITLAMVKAGGRKEECEQKVRGLLNWAGLQVKQLGQTNPGLADRIKNDEYFKPIRDQLEKLFDPRSYVGRASEQVTHFLHEEVNPRLLPYGDLLMVL